MIIEFSNAKEAKSHHGLSVAIVVASSAFFFIPTTLIILGYLASQPTGTLVSPLPQGTLSQNISTSPSPNPTSNIQAPLVAAPNDSTASAKNVTAVGDSNIIDKTASVSAGLKEITVADTDIKAESQIYLSPRPDDTALYTVKSKSDGQVVIEASQVSDTVRYIDYQIVNP